jgi:hypothetical protein
MTPGSYAAILFLYAYVLTEISCYFFNGKIPPLIFLLRAKRLIHEKSTFIRDESKGARPDCDVDADDAAAISHE